jgi:hypothetical protein
MAKLLSRIDLPSLLARGGSFRRREQVQDADLRRGVERKRVWATCFDAMSRTASKGVRQQPIRSLLRCRVNPVRSL